MSRPFVIAVVLLSVFVASVAGWIQNANAVQHVKTSGELEREAAGPAPTDPGPLAKNLSAKLNPKDIRKAMRVVADWQLRESEGKFNQQWTYATLYDGLIAASTTTGDPKYREAVARAATDKFQWKMVSTNFPHADDEAIGKAYLALYTQSASPQRIVDTRATMDRLVARPDDPAKNIWWWCDALYMAPPVLAELARVTGDRKYLDYMDHEWSLTAAQLYNEQEHLYARDASFLHKTETNGKPLFWSRGNGWVLGGLVRVLTSMPADYPTRRYERQFRDMVERVASSQGADGLWRAGLLDREAYKEPEVSGTAFFTYAMAWGINTGRLPRAKYVPIVTKAWAGILKHVYADGRLGAIQPIGAAPDAVPASSSYVYGVGAFLMAGSELDRLATSRANSRSRVDARRQ